MVLLEYLNLIYIVQKAPYLCYNGLCLSSASALAPVSQGPPPQAAHSVLIGQLLEAAPRQTSTSPRGYVSKL